MNPKAMQRALSTIQQLLAEGEAEELRGLGKPLAKEEGQAGGEQEKCPACEAGTCEDPDHLSEEDMDGVASMYGQ